MANDPMPDIEELLPIVFEKGETEQQIWNARPRSPTGTSQSLHPADALAADEATIVQLLRDTAGPLPIAPGEWQGPRVGLLG